MHACASPFAHCPHGGNDGACGVDAAALSFSPPMQSKPLSMASQRCIATALCAAALLISSATALSWPLCENGGSVWVTERPRTEPQFPGANLWFFCEGSLNILGNAIDACVPSPAATNGTICEPQVPDAICQLLGYERAFNDDTSTVTARPNEPVISLNGDFCLRKGQYASELPSGDLAALPGEPCQKIDHLTCIRTLDTMATALTLGLESAQLSVLRPTPAAETLSETARVAEQAAAMEAPATEGAPSGRRLKAF